MCIVHSTMTTSRSHRFLWIVTVVFTILRANTILGNLFDATCSTSLTSSLYGYNITCVFTIVAPASHTLHHLSLNWSLPSQPEWDYKGAILLPRGVGSATGYVRFFVNIYLLVVVICILKCKNIVNDFLSNNKKKNNTTITAK